MRHGWERVARKPLWREDTAGSCIAIFSKDSASLGSGADYERTAGPRPACCGQAYSSAARSPGGSRPGRRYKKNNLIETTNYGLGDFYNPNGNNTDYAYDEDGHVRRDANKGIDSIKYFLAPIGADFKFIFQQMTIASWPIDLRTRLKQNL